MRFRVIRQGIILAGEEQKLHNITGEKRKIVLGFLTGRDNLLTIHC